MQPIKNVSCIVHLFLFSELPSYGLVGILGSLASVQMQPIVQDPIVGELVITFSVLEVCKAHSHCCHRN